MEKSFSGINLPLALARANAKSSSPEAFAAELEDLVKDSSENLSFTKLGDTFLVCGTHAKNRAAQRAGWRFDLLTRVSELLANPELEEFVRDGFVLLSEDRKTVTAASESGVTATAVVDEKTGLLYILQAGWDYIVVKTVLDFGPESLCGRSTGGRAFIDRDTVIATVSEDGTVTLGKGNKYVRYK